MDSTSLKKYRYSTLPRVGMLALALTLSAGSQLVSAQTLPVPTTTVCDIATNTQCVPVAVQYDQAYSYSTRVLDYLYPGAGWTANAGTGQLDLIVTTRSAGQSNAGLGFNVPDPITNANTNPINDSWGAGGTPSTTMLVKDLYNYLFTTFQANTPVFTFDQNETGGNPNLLVTAKVQILDGDGTTVLEDWFFDAVNNGAENLGSPVTAPGEITIPAINTASLLDTVTFDNNKGSGKFDYLLYIPDLNLADFDDDDNIFKLSWVFSDVDDGGEEITITGRFTGELCPNPDLPQCQVVPEPQSLALISLALLVMGIASSRRRHPRVVD